MLAAAVGGSVAACAAAVPPPRCRSLCCRLMASALFGMRAAPSRRNGGPRPSSALPLNRARRPRFADGGVRWGQKPARPLRGSAAPPCALAAPSRAAAAAGGPSGRLPPSHFFEAVAVGSSGATPPPSPRSPVLLRAAKVRGACFSGLWPPRRCGGAPLRSCPAPRFWPRGGAILFSLRRVWGLRRLRAALKVYRQVRCTWLRHPRHASYDAGTTCNAFLNRIALHLDELQVSC